MAGEAAVFLQCARDAVWLSMFAARHRNTDVGAVPSEHCGADRPP